MGSTRIAVATLQVTSTTTYEGKTTWNTGSWATKVFTFFDDPSDLNILKYGSLETGPGPVPESNLTNLPKDEWQKGFVYFRWYRDGNIIKWDTTDAGAGPDCCKGLATATVTPGGMNPPPSGVATPSVASTTSSQDPGSTVNTGTSASSGNVPSSSTPVATSPAIPAKSADRNRLSGGAVAGVAIGCLLAGVLISAFIFWLCWGRRRSRSSRSSGTSSMALMPPEKGAFVHAKSLGPSSGPHLTRTHALPQPLEDQAVSGEVSKIGNLIKNHVQSYYHSRPVNPGLINLDDITSLGTKSSISAGTLSTLLDNPESREVALRFCIAWVTISRLQKYGASSESLLPPEVGIPMREIAAVSHDSKKNLQAARWRVATADLLKTTYVHDAFSSSDSRNAAIRSLAQTLENILRPYFDPRMNNEERKRNLEEILKRSALFAFTLFSQPSSWDFDWAEEQGVKSGGLCIFPALVQVTNEAGEPIRPPRSFSEAVIRRLET